VDEKKGYNRPFNTENKRIDLKSLKERNFRVY